MEEMDCLQLNLMGSGVCVEDLLYSHEPLSDGDEGPELEAFPEELPEGRVVAEEAAEPPGEATLVPIRVVMAEGAGVVPPVVPVQTVVGEGGVAEGAEGAERVVDPLEAGRDLAVDGVVHGHEEARRQPRPGSHDDESGGAGGRPGGEDARHEPLRLGEEQRQRGDPGPEDERREKQADAVPRQAPACSHLRRNARLDEAPHGTGGPPLVRRPLLRRRRLVDPHRITPRVTLQGEELTRRLDSLVISAGKPDAGCCRALSPSRPPRQCRQWRIPPAAA